MSQVMIDNNAIDSSMTSLSHIIFGRETYMAEGRKIASAASRNGVMAGPVKH